MSNPSLNKFLTIRAGVIRTPATDAVIARLDPYFAADNHLAVVTSVFRDPAAQLRLIQDESRRHNIATLHPEVLSATVSGKMPWKSRVVYQWQPCWSKLLNLGFIVSPPLEAEALLDYYRGTENRKGRVIPASEHQSGLAFDIGGRGGRKSNVEDEVAIILGAMAVDAKIGISKITVERKNNCCHVLCKKIT